MKRIINTIFLLALATVINAQVTVESIIDSVQMFVGQQTGLHVSATVKGGQRVAFPKLKVQQYLAPGIEIVEKPYCDTTEMDDGMLKITQHLTLTAWEDSLYYIPQMKVKVDGREYLSKNLALKVLTVNVDTVHTNKFFGPKDVQDNPFLWSEWEVLLLWSSLAALLYVLCWLVYLRLKSNKPIVLKVRIVKRIPPHQRALNEIESIKKDGINIIDGQFDQKAYYTQLTDALRKYMKERFHFNAMEMTSSEIIARLKEEDDQEKLNELRMLFETADLVKFAKYQVAMSENDRNLVNAVDFINTTKQDNLPTEERIEPTVTEQQRQTMRMRLSLKWAMALLITLASAIVAYTCWMLWELRW